MVGNQFWGGGEEQAHRRRRSTRVRLGRRRQPDGAVEGGDRRAMEDQGAGSALEEAASGSDRGRRQLSAVRCFRGGLKNVRRRGREQKGRDARQLGQSSPRERLGARGGRYGTDLGRRCSVRSEASWRRWKLTALGVALRVVFGPRILVLFICGRKGGLCYKGLFGCYLPSGSCHQE
jgi:hypothetical protein